MRGSLPAKVASPAKNPLIDILADLVSALERHSNKLGAAHLKLMQFT